MAVNLTPSLAAGLGAAPPDKAHLRAWLEAIVAAINSDLDPRATPIYVTRDAAIAAAPLLPSSLTHIVVREGTALVVRSRTAFADDPLFETGARWGVVQRQDVAAETKARSDAIREIDARVAAMDPRSTPTYGSRAAAVVAAPALPTAVPRMLVLDGLELQVRGRGATADDPLFASGDPWGVVYRINVAALQQAAAGAAGTASDAAAVAAETRTALRAMARWEMGVGDYLGGLFDRYLRPSWLVARKSDGGPPEDVVEMLAERLAPHLDGGPTQGVLPSDRYLRADGTVAKAMPNMAQASIWGSSSAAFLAPYLNDALLGLGVSVYSGSRGGERCEHTFARLGSRPALLTFPSNTIPASGAVNVTSSNMPASTSLLPYAGRIGGVAGTLDCPTDGSIRFTRTEAGAAVAVPANSPFLPDIGPRYRGDVTLLWARKNNFSPTVTGEEGPVIAATDQAFDWMLPLFKRVLVLGHFADRDLAEVSLERTQILATNAAHAARYGDLYVDTYGYLTGAQVWLDTGITPTATDLAQQAKGNKPSSLSSDNLHLNAAGSAAVAALIRKRMIDLGWYKE